VPGSGVCLDVGFITYSPSGKAGFLGVKEATMKQYGLTSEEVAREMAEGARRQEGCCVDVVVSNTSLADAGPKAVRRPAPSALHGHFARARRISSPSPKRGGFPVTEMMRVRPRMKQIRELQRLPGTKTMEVEILREAVEYGREKIDCALTIAAGGRPMKTVCEVLGVSRSNLAVKSKRPAEWVDQRKMPAMDDMPLVSLERHPHLCLDSNPPFLYQRLAVQGLTDCSGSIALAVVNQLGMSLTKYSHSQWVVN
jgi:hypothetical protein